MDPKRQSKTSPVPAKTDLSGWQPGHPDGDENGFIIIAVIALVAILALVGTVAVMTTTTEIKISSNYKTGVQAFHAAQAGAEEARARLRGSSDDDDYAGDPAASPDSTWSAYILTSDTWQLSDDPDYAIDTYKKYIPLYDPVNHTNIATETNTIQEPPYISYWVKIRHKREYDAEQDGHAVASTHYYDDDGDLSINDPTDPGNIIYYGYGDPSTPTTEVQFATSTTTVYKPVEIITSYGSSGSSSQIIKTEVVRYTGPPIVSALYGKDNMTINGGATTSIDGTDNCGATDLPPIYLFDGNDGELTENPAPDDGYGGNPDEPQSGDIDIDIDEYVNTLEDTATEIIIADQLAMGTTFGDNNTFVTCYSDTSDPPNNQGLKMTNVTGYGLLLVEGDLELGGGFTWNGLILVTGKLKISGGGLGINILGAVLANQTTEVSGNIDIQYDSCMIDDALNNQSMKVIRWEDKKLK